MKKVVIVFSSLLLFSMCCSALAGTNEVLVALEELKSAVNSGVSKNNFDMQFSKVDAQINIAKRDKKISEKFIFAAVQAKGNYCFSYDMARLDAKDKADEAFAQANKYLDSAYELANH